ncbi:ATP-binding protein, partial [Sphaerisporangium rubeum]
MRPREVQWDLPDDRGAVCKGREIVRAVLREWGLDELIDDAETIVSELYTNALRHGVAPYTLSLRVAGRCLGGEVTDHGPLFVPPQLPADDDQEHGRGLRIVAAYSTGWGVDPAEVGKVVWFT